MEGSVQFWINYGKKAYERGKYEKALEELEYEYQTLRVYSYVASQVKSLTRINNLSWNHHRLVAPYILHNKKIGWTKQKKEAGQSPLSEGHQKSPSRLHAGRIVSRIKP